ncbi:polyhydroxyalkanoic acid system family protein [Altererythrobacter sp. ZODW24]|uniref:polyhydroxyalkanoic acid system family protein n=1 Tax=Altererythrobacter sp. ZODW24 TaxID=2185142 RepID=UPI000DF84997|nr:polyhydroxyalkanoic acid system family protein [Altererythrobacter sp. ZODW24]
MQVPISHDLPKDEVRRRLRERSHEIADHIPGGMAEIETNWSSEDQMDMTITAMGQNLVGKVEVEDNRMVLSVELPMALSFVQPVIEAAMKKQGQKLLS